MALTQAQQIYEAIKNSKNPLITFSQDHNGDAIASSLALALFLKKIDKNHTIVCSAFKLPKQYAFLPQSRIIKDKIDALQQFIISIDTTQSPFHGLDYKEEKGKLHIYIEPKNGSYRQKDVSIAHSHFKYDLIITINTPDLESLNSLFEDNTDFFYQTPLLNIDNVTENEYYGHYNIVNVTATSTAEIIYDLIYEIDPQLLDEEIATCLLTGMINKTKSFRTMQVTPKSLSIASRLIALGANRDEIIKNLYHTKSIATLKLWGKALTNLQTNPSNTLAWTHLTQQDFQKTQTTSNNLPALIDEIISNILTVMLSAIFYQTPEGPFVLIQTEKNLNLLDLLHEFKPVGSKRRVKMKLDVTTPETIITYLKKILPS